MTEPLTPSVPGQEGGGETLGQALNRLDDDVRSLGASGWLLRLRVRRLRATLARRRSEALARSILGGDTND